MRDAHLWGLLTGVWALAPLLAVLGWLGPAPSLSIMPVVAVLAGALAASWRRTMLVPAAALVPLILVFGAKRVLEGASGPGLVPSLAVMFVIHAVPVVVVAAGIWWVLEWTGRRR